jgi:acetolactate synthase-1/2/3 large subunit
MKVTTYIAKFLKEKGIDTIFELQGGMITRIIDEIHHEGGIKIVSMHHEQAAAFAADAYARVTNKPGVALATSGPGATNLITGIGSCFFDSIPAIFITGQVNTNEQKGESKTRQIGFQETDIVTIVKPITKAAYAIKKAAEIPHVFEEAYLIAMQGRPGPVLIDIPMNIQNLKIEISPNVIILNKEEDNATENTDFLDTLLSKLKTAKKPLVLAGRGIRCAALTNQLINFIEQLNIPLVTSLLGFDVIPYHHPNRIGFIGTYGNRWANYALGSCDLLIVLGSRLDNRQTGADVDSFIAGKEIFHVDIEPAELNNRIKGCTTLRADLKQFFIEVEKQDIKQLDLTDWRLEIDTKYQEKKDTDELINISGINPNSFIHQLAQASLLAKVITSDVGNNQMWASQSYELANDQLFLSSGGMGAMGYSLPASIGASIALGSKPVVALAGDGGFQINIQELQTIRRNNLPIKMVILNNHCLGMIRQFQDSYFDSCYQSTVWGYNTPDFTKVALAYGIDSYSINNKEDIETGLAKLWGNPSAPFLLDVSLDIHTNVFPKMMFGSPITKMEGEGKPINIKL